MFIKVASFIAAAAFVSVVVAESHNVQLINNCGSGNPVFLYQNTPGTFGSGTYDRLLGGVAWIDGFAGANCLSSGVNCGTVEFSLTNPENTDGNTQNAANFSLLKGIDPTTGQDLGNHQFTYPMNFAFNGGACDGVAAPGQCTGDSEAECKGAFLGTNSAGGSPVQCTQDNAGIVITFC